MLTAGLTDGWTDGRTHARTDDRRKVITIAHPEHSSGELKKDIKSYFLTSGDTQTCPWGKIFANSECVPPVLIHRAIACESFEILV